MNVANNALKGKRIFVTGSGGMVGHYIGRVFGDCELCLTDIGEGFIKLDVTDARRTERLIRDFSPDIVMHMAAATDVDRCQRERDWAYRCNMDATRNVAISCSAAGAVMVYLSSGSVFSGKLNRPATEDDAPDPVNIYGQSKLAGEEEVISAGGKYLIVRAGWMMGGGRSKDKKFIGKIMEKILSGDRLLKVIDDKFGSPVYAKDLLAGIRKLIEAKRYGTYHMVNANKKRVSRYDIALSLKKALGMDDLSVEPVSSENFNLSAPRALSEELQNHRLMAMGLDIMRPWQAALDEYISEDWKTDA